MKPWALLVLFLLGSQEPPSKVDFDRDIRPIFQATCQKCHGGEGKPKGQFRLDLRALALKGGVTGKSILPGSATGSRLYTLLLAPEDDARMPQKAPPLPREKIELIRRWIDEGARWPDDGISVAAGHWSLRPLGKPAVPKAGPWARTPIDAFILARLEEKGFAPAPPADPRTLLRRITYDLTGLPPTPGEMDAFLSDPAPDAYEKAVDRLLESPRYGERWARHWLDVVHYADTHGHDQDRPRPNAWPYRDYVIGSFNGDTPYARFVQEQLAGDALFPDDPRGIVATGFIAAGPWDESSQMHIMADTVDKKIAQNLDRDDMVATTMSTFVSTTVHCARCHNHKFDPVLQSEHYALQACFAGVDRASRPFDDDPAVNRRRQDLLRRKTELAVRKRSLLESLPEPDLHEEAIAWTVLDPATYVSSAGATLTKLEDHSILSSGERPESDTYTITARCDLGGITAVRLEVLTVDDLPRKGPGRQDNGNLHLSEFRVLADGRPVTLQNPTADFNQEGWTIAQAIDGKLETAWGIYPEVGKPHLAVFELKEPAGPGVLTFILEQKHGRHHLIARPRLSVTAAPPPVRVTTLPEPIARIAAIPASRRSAAEKTEIAAYAYGKEIDRELSRLPPPRRVYAAANDFAPVAKFTPARVPRPIFLLRRGDVTRPAEPVVPGALSCVGGLDPVFRLADPDDEGERRAALARWITDPRNVLTWRSIVNRVWHYHFGRGIVDTPSDFGRMGGTPTHPEMLDWLASWFLENGGSLKKLHRLILSSAVYRQSSRHDPRMAAADSGNLLLWRMNRLRLDAEQVRDGVLQISGKLDLTMGGPSVKQFRFEDPNPDLTPKVDYANFDVDHPDNFRRSIYRYLFRTLPDPFMDSLDCADASQLTPTRNLSVTALQAMALMNDRFIVRQSEHVAAQVGNRIEELYRRALQRPPTAEEARALSGYAARHGMANACRLLINSNEFMFLD
jgi:hypothetical protein